MTGAAASNPTSTTTEPVESAKRRKSRLRLGGSLLAMGILHVIVPKPFEKIVPKALGRPKLWNRVAAAAEAGAGALLLSSDAKARRVGGYMATATLVGVYPANIEMAIRAGKPTNLAAITAWTRLPFQFPMIKEAYQHTRPLEAS